MSFAADSMMMGACAISRLISIATSCPFISGMKWSTITTSIDWREANSSPRLPLAAARSGQNGISKAFEECLFAFQ
jgi:hypothetical protein